MQKESLGALAHSQSEIALPARSGRTVHVLLTVAKRD
jgi:hypothetical protein